MRSAGILLLLALVSSVAYADGAETFSARCAVCHQADGHGVPGVYPPLANSVGDYLRLSQGRAYLVHVVSFGMTGAITSHGQTYSGFMQPWQQLSDREL